MKLATIDAARYGKCLHNAQKVAWDIDADVIRFRQLGTDCKKVLELGRDRPHLAGASVGRR